ncbi:MAG TPA: Asp-tRNA(Asn)/Glu-tRNA(Gln) amidotransferase subunit GatC [Dehalococcoidia bacterium]|nr:Asp-tRNA(Asn)/Glu-tRNA(Gln) amidotransferase subunit GatC [Dehalococcoidia bacterium]
MSLDRAEVEHLASLVRIGLTNDEIETLRDQLSDILEQFQVLRELDTRGVIPTGHAGNLATVMRDDLPGDCLTVAKVISNAPRTEGGLIRVKAVLEE